MRSERAGAFVMLENGDLSQGMGRQQEMKFETAVMAMNEMGYDALNLGEQDLLLGTGFLRYVADLAEFPFLSANLVYEGRGRFFKPWTIKSVELGTTELKIGIVGIISHDLASDVQDLNLGLTLQDPSEVLAPILDQLDDQADLIILLAHASDYEARGLAESFPAIDVIICSHSGDDPLFSPSTVGDTIITYAGEQGRFLGVTDVSTGQDKQVTGYEFEAIALNRDLVDSEDIAALLDLYREMVKGENLLARAPKLPSGDITFSGSSECKRCHSLPTFKLRNDKHHKAYHTLEEKNYHYDPECVVCHTTGFEYASGFANPEATPELAEIGCEGCHGPGSKHIEEPLEAEYSEVEKEVCLNCHDLENSPGFEYEAAVKDIEHTSFFLCSAKVCHFFK